MEWGMVGIFDFRILIFDLNSRRRVALARRVDLRFLTGKKRTAEFARETPEMARKGKRNIKHPTAGSGMNSAVQAAKFGGLGRFVPLCTALYRFVPLKRKSPRSSDSRLRVCLKTPMGRRVRAHGPQDPCENPSSCRPGALTGRVFIQALRIFSTTKNAKHAKEGRWFSRFSRISRVSPALHFGSVLILQLTFFILSAWSH